MLLTPEGNSRPRLVIIFGAGILLIITAGYLARPLTVDAPAGPVNETAYHTPAGDGVMPRGYRPAAPPLRDPFALPEQPVGPGADSAGRIPDGPAAAPDQPRPVAGRESARYNGREAAVRPQVTGIIVSGDRRAAIIQYKQASRVYYPGDKIGPFQLIFIADDWVVVDGPAGRSELALGR